MFGPSGFWTMAPLLCAAKFDPFLSLDCAPRPPPWRNPMKGRDQILPSGNLAPALARKMFKLHLSPLGPSTCSMNFASRIEVPTRVFLEQSGKLKLEPLAHSSWIKATKLKLYLIPVSQAYTEQYYTRNPSEDFSTWTSERRLLEQPCFLVYGLALQLPSGLSSCEGYKSDKTTKQTKCWLLVLPLPKRNMIFWAMRQRLLSEIYWNWISNLKWICYQYHI